MILLSERFQYLVISKEIKNLDEFLDKHSSLVDEIKFRNKDKTCFIIETDVSKDYLEGVLDKYLISFAIFETEKPTLDDLLDKISRKEKLGFRDNWLLEQYSKE